MRFRGVREETDPAVPVGEEEDPVLEPGHDHALTG
jgi:hypothetical protein